MRLLLSVCFFLFSVVSHADTRGLLGASIAFDGGDNLAEAQGGDLPAGQGLLLQVGFQTEAAQDLGIRIAAGAKSNLDSSGQATFASINREIATTILYTPEKFSVGAGVVAYPTPQFSFIKSGREQTVEFDTTFGIELLFGFEFGDANYIELKHTKIDFRNPEMSSSDPDLGIKKKTYTASNTSISLIFLF